ncbi:MAG: glycosyltransferase family 9 protein [Candidatus Omnitrophica bacterium]|nr:glycosyltransferase family 9 protein [Candidatus Omnitrophota bacterium]
MKIKNKEKIKRALLISLSNFGDIILTTPVLSALKRELPNAEIDVMSGPAGSQIFVGHPLVSNFIAYDKFANLRVKAALIFNLRKKRYDLTVDLRSSLFAILTGSRYHTPLMGRRARGPAHKMDEHLRKLETLGLDTSGARFAFYVGQEDRSFIDKLLAEGGIKKDFVVVAPGAKSHIKRWAGEGFALACDRLIKELALDIVMVGDSQDKEIIDKIARAMRNKAHDLSSKLSLRQLGALIARSKLLITNDSAPMHIGCSLGAKVLAVFGPTDPKKYGPLGARDVIMRKGLDCSPCELAQCGKNHECMKLITADEVFEMAQKMLRK